MWTVTRFDLNGRDFQGGGGAHTATHLGVAVAR